MKNILGKIFVFALFIMSLVLMTFAIAIYSSHTNWQTRDKETSEKLEKLRTEAKTYKDDKERLEGYVAESEAARDQVIAKFQQALLEKDKDLKALQEERVAALQKLQTDLIQLQDLQTKLSDAQRNLENKRKEAEEKKKQVDEEVQAAAKLATELHEKESLLAIANERKAQLEKQVDQARQLLKQAGLSIDSLPKNIVPKIDGVVTAVVDDAIEVSLGTDDGLQKGHPIDVYRNNEYLGRVIVKSVKPDRAVAVILREYSRGIIQRGDKVTTKLDKS